jgi:hypothetical protein
MASDAAHDEGFFEFIENIGMEAVSAYKDALRRYRQDPGVLRCHQVPDGLWFDWVGGPVTKCTQGDWRDWLYRLNANGELPWVLCVLAIGPDQELYLIRASHEELEEAEHGA